MSTIGDTLTAQATNAAAQRGTAYASAVALGTSKLHMRHSSSADADVNEALTSAPARFTGVAMCMVEVSDAESQDVIMLQLHFPIRKNQNRAVYMWLYSV